MQGQRGRNERRAGVFFDMAHLILGIAIVIFAVLSFISPEGNRMLFPQTVDKVPAKAGLFYIYNRFSGIMGLSERRCFL